jgi:putative PIN family toxin of toxin-antitoxin system
VRVVADTNVYISALNFGGTAEEVLALGRMGAITLLLSTPILQEIEGVLMRKFRWSARRTREATALLREFADLVKPRETITVIREDEPDNRILECALEAAAQVIISGDHHLRRLRAFRRIPILGPADFLEMYRSEFS